MSSLQSLHLNLEAASFVQKDGIEYGLLKTAGDPMLGDPLPGRLGRAEHLRRRLPPRPNPAPCWSARSIQRTPPPCACSCPGFNPVCSASISPPGWVTGLGLATPGHVRAIRNTGGKIDPIFAQQSMREMARTGRTPIQVMDDATWGIFDEGWQGGYGADADHLKTPEDIDICLAAGFTFFTIDPGAHVNNLAEVAAPAELEQMAAQLPPEMQPRLSGLDGKTFDIEGTPIRFDKITLLKAAVKYGRAVSHVAAMYRHLAQAAGTRPFELEVSVDETDQPTSHAEHIYIASELKRLGVEWVSLAPRYVGRFEKGVDYIGDLGEFRERLRRPCRHRPPTWTVQTQPPFRFGQVQHLPHRQPPNQRPCPPEDRRDQLPGSTAHHRIQG